jgi:hypothetical protein
LVPAGGAAVAAARNMLGVMRGLDPRIHDEVQQALSLRSAFGAKRKYAGGSDRLTGSLMTQFEPSMIFAFEPLSGAQQPSNASNPTATYSLPLHRSCFAEPRTQKFQN